MSFKAKTKYANRFKTLFELLFNNMMTICLTIDDQGISIKIITTQNITFDIDLPADKFEEYVFDSPEPIHIGLGNTVKKFFKTVKNKSVVEFSITDPFLFNIKVISDNNCKSDLSVNIANVQNIAPFNHIEYSVAPVSVPNTNFSKMCRSFMTPVFYLSKANGELTFGSTMDQIYKKTFRFGEVIPSDISLFYQQYRTDQIIRIIKIASFVPKSIMIYAEQNLPLLFKTVSEIGTIKTYITSTIE